MSSHHIAIAKASFAAGLLRPDPQAVSRDQIAYFHTVLNEALVKCSPPNIQKCKRWIMSNVVQSTGRCTALGKYLAALSSSFNTPSSTPEGRQPSDKRRRLHLLYLINDVIHHGQAHSSDASIVGKFQPVLMRLFGSAASFRNCPKHQGKLHDLLDIWDKEGYYSKEYIGKLREAVRSSAEGETADGNHEDARKEGAVYGSKAKNAPYVMPATHGDSGIPWYDLPAANIMPLIIPNSTRPINPADIRPLRFVAGPADDTLTVAVKSFLKDVDKMFNSVEDIGLLDHSGIDVDELGQSIVRDEINGEVLEAEGYYGWSQQFCEKMKQRRKNQNIPLETRDRSRSLSSSRSAGSISVGFKRRRHSPSSDDSYRSRSRSHNRRYRSSSSSRDRRKSFKNGSKRASPARGTEHEPTPVPVIGRTPATNRTQDSEYPQNRYEVQRPPQSSPHIPHPSLLASQGQQYGNFVPPPPGPHAQQYGQFFPPPPPPGQWQHPFPPPPPAGYDEDNAPPPPPPLFPLHPNSWQQGQYGHAPPSSVGVSSGWPTLLQSSDRGSHGGGAHGMSGRGAHNQQWQGRGRGNPTGRGW